MDQGVSLDGLRRTIGLPLRRLAGLTGIPYPRVRRILREGWPARRTEAAAIRRSLDDESRIAHSSDPALLRHIIERAAPFLEERDARPR